MICDDCGRPVAEWRGEAYEVDRDVWRLLCHDCAEGRENVDADRDGYDLYDIECPRCQSETDRETVGRHDYGEQRRVVACNDCGLVYTRPDRTTTWSDELYLLCVRKAGAPDSHVMVEAHTFDEQYADIVCSSAAASNIVPSLRCEGYRFEEQRGNGGSVLRTRIRVWPDD